MNVAVFLPNWIGDAVMATPALRALRGHFADARIIGVMKPYVAGVLAGGNWFDEVVYTKGKWRPHNIFTVAWLLRQRRLDLAVLLTNTLRSALTAFAAGAGRRIGYAGHGRSLLLTDVLLPVCDRHGRRIPSPVIDAYNRLAREAGCPVPGHRLELFTAPADEQTAERVWHLTRLSAHREVICLNPGAAFGSSKHWPSEHFAALAHELAGRRGAGVLVLCGPREQAAARRIATMACHPAVHALADVGVPLSLGLTKACVRRCDLLITTDSGPRHFAAAFDRPVVTLFGSTHIDWTETYHPRAVHLQKQVDCGPCQRRTCPLDHRCMNDLLPGEVLAASQRLLEGRYPLAG